MVCPDACAFGRPLTILLLVVIVGCAAATRGPATDTGTITVGVTTTGTGIDTLTFSVTIHPGGVDGTVKADAGVFTRSRIPVGNHVVRLEDLPARCRVQGAAERTVTISQQRRSAVLQYEVQCR